MTPPPPALPPPLLATANDNGVDDNNNPAGSITENNSEGGGVNIDNNNKKKVLIATVVVVGICICAAIGLGVGFGLQNNNESSDADKSSTTTNVVGDSDAASDGDGQKKEQEDEPEPEPVETETHIQIQYDAVLIGAGWAGIRMAQTLINRGITNILILESANHVGGRSKSYNPSDGSYNNPDLINDMSNIPYDLGSEWLYPGTDQGDFLANGGYLNDASLSSIEEDKTVLPIKSGQFYQQLRDEETGELTATVLQDADEWLREIWYDGFMAFRNDRWNQLKGKSYAGAIDEFIDRWSWTDDESLQFLNLIEDGLEIEYGGNSDNIDIHQVDFNEKEYTIDSYFMSTPGQGFGNVAAKYAEPFRDVIRLNSRVVEVNSSSALEDDNNGHGDGRTVAVTYIDEDGNTNLIKAKTVAVTVSLGVLKAGVIDFVPPLREEKQRVINEMGFGVLNRCSMIWDKDYDYPWPIGPKWFIVMTPEDETSGQWTTFNNPTKIKGEPSLVSWVGGTEAVEAEKKTDDEILNDVMVNLKSMFPTIRKPDQAIIARWGLDENVYGAYSHPVPGRDIYADAKVLKETHGGIFFAGEATGSGWATTMGAWTSGEATAGEIVDMLQTM